jgi:membrane-associated phospholipid phosphatase
VTGWNFVGDDAREDGSAHECRPHAADSDEGKLCLFAEVELRMENLRAESVPVNPLSCFAFAGWRVFATTLVCIAGLADSAAGGPFNQGQRPDSLFSSEYLHLLFTDTTGILSSPARWNESDWETAGVFGAAIAGTAVFDRKVRDWSQDHRTSGRDRFFRVEQRLGAEWAFAVLGGFEAWGATNGDRRAEAVVMDGLASSLIAGGIISPAIKYSVGRVRPNSTPGTYQFQPFSGNQSFPSGHTTQAFAVASVIAEHYDQWWVQAFAYGAAGLVGVARIEQNTHFASDVVAGAILSTMVGRSVVQRNNGTKTAFRDFAPYVDRNGYGLQFSKDF